MQLICHSPSRQDVTEVVAAEKLDSLRAEQADFVSLSFPTISGSGPNAAVIHYHATKESCGIITTDQIYLCDSGAQFRDGTTDGEINGTACPQNRDGRAMIIAGKTPCNWPIMLAELTVHLL